MTFSLDKYIDEYIRDADEFNKKIALHLKEIIPQTTHLDEKVLNAIIEELMNEMGNGKDFKEAFHKKRKRFILTGDRIDAELPGSFIRFVLNVREFLEYISNIMGVEVDEVESIIKSRGIRSFIHYIGHLSLASIENDVVFATFDEDHLGNDPFTDYNVSDIINMLAMDRNRFKSGEPLSVVKIIYRNKKDIEKKFPIFFDAGWYDKFYPTERKDKYGRTRSLDPDLKNMPEIVHRNIKISEVTEDIQFFED